MLLTSGKWLIERPEVVEHCREYGIDPAGLKPYFFRHSFLTRWVEDGGDTYIVAQLCGTSVKMVEKRYGHPNVDKLHERFLAFVSQKRTTPPSATG